MPSASSDVDYEVRGKQISYFTIDGMSERLGAALQIPLAVIKNGSGRTLYLNGGTHGDEVEGPIVLNEICRTLNAEDISGRLIITPMLNLPAVLVGTRLSPIDGLDLNRSFPGRADGSATMAIADYVCREILPRADAVLDLHAGGLNLSVVPSVMMHPLADRDLMTRTFDAVRAFAAPASVVAEEADREAMLDSVVERSGKVFICAELGGGGGVTPETLEIARTGVRNLLKHFDMISGDFVPSTWQGRQHDWILEVPDEDWYVHAARTGLYEPIATLAQKMEAGDVVGRLHPMTSGDGEPVSVIAPRRGFLYCQRVSGLANAGDVTAIVARPLR